MTALVIVITGTWQVSAEVSDEAGVAMVAEPGSSEVVKQLDAGQYIHVNETRTSQGQQPEAGDVSW